MCSRVGYLASSGPRGRAPENVPFRCRRQNFIPPTAPSATRRRRVARINRIPHTSPTRHSTYRVRSYNVLCILLYTHRVALPPLYYRSLPRTPSSLRPPPRERTGQAGTTRLVVRKCVYYAAHGAIEKAIVSQVSSICCHFFLFFFWSPYKIQEDVASL